MKNEQNSQNSNQDQVNRKSSTSKPEDMQQQNSMQSGPGKPGKQNQTNGNEKSNISVGNDGKISNDDQWVNSKTEQSQKGQDQNWNAGQGNKTGYQNSLSENAKSERDPETDDSEDYDEDGDLGKPQGNSNKNSK